MSAELLREAAAKMRERADSATSGKWEHVAIEDEAGCSDSYVWALSGYSSIGEDVGESMTVEDAEHIASWHPAVALAVADLLDLAAAWVEDHPGSWPPANKAALALARAYLKDPS